MAVRIGDVTIRIGASTRELEADLRRAERSLQATADKFTNIGQNLTLGVTAPVLAAGAAAFKMASDYEESLNKVRVAFGGSSESVEQFAKTAIDSIGLAEQSALDMAALFGDMATSMGLTQPAAAQMSTSLVQLAGDLASFKNINIEEATTALAGVFTGETESLKRLGVVMTEANVQAYALEKGIKKKLNTMSQAEKVSLRYQYVLDATKNAQGDFARTSDGAANQMRTLQQSVKDLGSGFGKLLLPIITPIIQKLVEAVKSFSSLDTATKKTIITVAGLAAAIGPVIIIYGQLGKAYGLLQIGTQRIIALWIQQAAAVAAANGGIPTLTASTVTLGTTIRATLTFLAPYAAAIGLVAVGIYALYRSYKDANNQIDKNAELTKKASDAIASEQAQTQALIAVIRDENKSKKEKEGALRKLQDIAPEYFKNLSIEKSSIKDINAAYASYNASIERSIKAKIGKEDLESQIKDERRLLQSIKDRQSIIDKAKPKTPEKVTLPLTAGGSEQASQIKALKSLYSDQSAELKQLKSIQQLKDETLKFINANEDLISSVDSGSKSVGEISTKTDEYTKKIQQLNIDLQNNQKLLQAGLLTAPEAAEKKLGILEKKLETLVLSGLNPASSAIVDVKEEISSLRQVSDVELLPTAKADVQSLIPIFQNLAQTTQKANLDNLAKSMQVSKAPATEIQTTLSNLRTELENIEKLTDNGIISDKEADIKRIETLKKALQDAISQGANPEVIKGIQNEINTIKPSESFKETGQKLQEQFSAVAEVASQVATPLFATINQGLQNQSARLDEYYAKEKALIEGSTLTEEQKAEKLAQLDAKVAKERKKIARDQAKSAKAQALFDATINGTLAVIKAFGQGGPVLAAVVGGLVAAQIAAIAAQPLPSLAIGTDLVKRDGLAMIHKGEAIVPANVARGGFSGRAGGQLTGKLSGIDILISAENSRRYLNKVG